MGKKRITKALSFFMIFALILTNLFAFTLTGAYASESTTVFVETFDNLTLSGTNYVNGSFIGQYGIEWTYTHVTGEQDYPIDGKGLLLRRSGDGSKIVSNAIQGGIGSFTVDMRKGFTGSGDRQIELFINGVSKGKSIAFGGVSGVDDTIHTFEVNDINITGEIVIEIRHVTGGTQNRHLVIDNITWTSYIGDEITVSNVTASPPPGAVDAGTDVSLFCTTTGASIYYTLDGTEPDNTSTKYESTPIVINEATTIKAIAGLNRHDTGGVLKTSEISTFDYTIKVPSQVMTIAEARDLAVGTEVTVEGVITAKLGNGLNIFFQDETAGIVARLSSSSWGSSWQLGDKIRVKGVLGAYAQLIQVNVSSQSNALIVEAGAGMPEAALVSLDQISNNLQGQLIKVEGLTIKSAGGSGSYNVTAEDIGGNTIIIRVENNLVAGSFFEVGKVVDVTAPLGKFNNDFQLMVRGPQDLVEVNLTDVVKAVTANPEAGIVPAGTEVFLSSETEGAAIYYTLDGSIPSEGSILYDLPIEITETVTIKAIALKDAMTSSGIRSFTYTVLDAPDGSISVAQLKRLPLDTEATVKGIVIAKFGANEAYIESGNTGIQVFRTGLGSKLEIGDEVKITGRLSVYGRELQLQPNNIDAAIEVLSRGNDIPQAISATLKTIGQTRNFVDVATAVENYVSGNTATVRGFITSRLPNSTFAVEIADRVDTTKTMNVQLPAGYRGEFNPHPSNNPSAVGRIVIVTGQTKDYSNGKGLRNDYSGPFLIGYDVEGLKVTTSLPFQVTGKDNYGFFIKDAEGSAYVYTARASNFSLNNIKVGDWYTVTGVAAFYNNPQIKLADGGDLVYAVPPGQQDPREPLVLNVKPSNYSATYSTAPLISADLERTVADILYDNIKLLVDGIEVEADINQETNRVSYQPSALVFGQHDVEIRVPDAEGRIKTFKWFFVVENQAASYSFYYGIPHAHTSYSDGAGTPTQAFNHAKGNRLDFLAITDHSNWLDGVTNGNFEFETGRNEYIEKDNPQGQPSQWKSTRLEAEAFNAANSDFLAIRGFEMTSSIWGHMNTINSSTYVEAKKQMVPMADYYDWIIDVSTREGENVFSMFNHPNWPDDSFSNLAYIPQLDRYVNGIEVGNGAPPYSYSRAEGHYWRALDNGWRVGAMNSQDNHATNWGDRDNLTVVIAESLTTDGIIDAMNARRMYSTETKTLELTFKGNDFWMGSVIDVAQGSPVQFTVLAEDVKVPIAKLQLITNGGYVLDEIEYSGGTNGAAWSPSVIATGGAEWFVIKVIHSNGAWGHSSPIFTVAGENDVKLTGIKVNPDPTLPGFNTTLEATVTNMGIRIVEGIQVKFYQNSISEDNLIATVDLEDGINPGASIVLSANWIPRTFGQQRIIAKLTDIPNVTTVTEISTAVKVVKPIGKKILFDGAHGNADVPGTVVKIIEMLRLYGYEATINTVKPITSSMLENYDVLIINTPLTEATAFTEAEEIAIADWVNGGGSIMLASKSNYGQDSTLFNSMMAKIGTKIRFNNDNVYEPADSPMYTGGMVWSVIAANLPFAPSGLNRNMEAIRIFSGSSLRHVNGGPLVNDPTTNLEILLGGNATSYNYNPQGDAYVYNLEGNLDGERIPMIAIETVGNGKIVAAGRHFYSDFEIGNDVSNTALTLLLIDWLAGYDRIRTIEDIRENAQEGDIVTVRGVVTAPTDHFFDVIYIQDETSGVCIYGSQTKNNLPIGTEVIATGRVTYFEGELELAFENYDFEVMLVGPVGQVAPRVLSNTAAMSPQYTGMLITTLGEIIDYNPVDGNFIITDGVGMALVQIDGYLGLGMDRFKVGDRVTVTGIASIGAGGPRIRVRFPHDLDFTEIPGFEFPVIINQITTVDIDGNVTNSFDLNSTIQVKAEVYNTLENNLEAMVIIKVMDSHDRPYAIRFVPQAQLLSEATSEFILGFGTTGLDRGSYRVQVYVWDNWNSREALSLVGDTIFIIQ